MIRFSIHLPTRHRIDIHFVKNRGVLDEKPILPPLGKILNVKKGSLMSRFFRHIFEHKRINKILGTNLLILLFASSFISNKPNLDTKVMAAEIKSPQIITTESGIQFPTANILITQGYGFFHRGIDFDGYTGDQIKPISRGMVKIVEYSKFGYGISVLVDHGNGLQSLYAHLSKTSVKVGQEVTIDSKIGEMGATGKASGDHLHLEIYDNGKTINPLSVLPNSYKSNPISLK